MKSDTELENDVMDEIKRDPNTNSPQIGVLAANGIVTLTGTVSTFDEKLVIERATQRVQGVKGIAEEITVKITGPHIKHVETIDQDCDRVLTGKMWIPSKMRINRLLLSARASASK